MRVGNRCVLHCPTLRLARFNLLFISLLTTKTCRVQANFEKTWFFVTFGAVQVLKLISSLHIIFTLLNISLLIALVLLTVPSSTPLFRQIFIAFWTASLFLFIPAANSLKDFRLLFMALSIHFPVRIVFSRLSFLWASRTSLSLSSWQGHPSASSGSPRTDVRSEIVKGLHYPFPYRFLWGEVKIQLPHSQAGTGHIIGTVDLRHTLLTETGQILSIVDVLCFIDDSYFGRL